MTSTAVVKSERLPDDQPRSAVKGELSPHERKNVDWIENIYREGKGGIFPDDPKSICAFLSDALVSGGIRSALLVVPTPLVELWRSACQASGLGFKPEVYLAHSKPEGFRRIARAGGVLITTYGMVQRHHELLSTVPGRLDCERGWDIVICAEGQKLKNPKTLLHGKIAAIPARSRFILTDNPIQNHVVELWSLCELAVPGILGSLRDFKKKFELPIICGAWRDSGKGCQEQSKEAANSLRTTIKPYILHRETAEKPAESLSNPLLETIDDEDIKPEVPQVLAGTVEDAKKEDRRTLVVEDVIVWINLTPTQRQLYQYFVEKILESAALNTQGSTWKAITFLKPLCLDPPLFWKRVVSVVRKAPRSGDPESRDPLAALCAEILQDNKPSKGAVDSTSPAESCKKEFLMQLLPRLIADGHRILVACQRTGLLDLLEKWLRAANISCLKLDRRVRGADKRKRLVDAFQNPPTGTTPIPVFLLSSKVARAGLNLTAADRVVILDPDWNPTVDDQVVDRVYCPGQTRDVVVHRLVTCGTVEEKKYRNQVLKRWVSQTAREPGKQPRFFDYAELASSVEDLLHFDAKSASPSVTRERFMEMHDSESRVRVKKHADYLKTLPHVEGVSDHGLVCNTRRSAPLIKPEGKLDVSLSAW